MGRKIDKLPPHYSGDIKQDMQSVITYLAYLNEQINFLAAKLEKLNEESKRS